MTTPAEPVHVRDALTELKRRRDLASTANPAVAAGRIRPDILTAGDSITITDPTAYAASALTRIVGDLAATTKGGRNAAAHEAARSIGRMVGGGLPVDKTGACLQLLDACNTNGMVADDGEASAVASIRSGYMWGYEHPLTWTHTPATNAPAGTPFDAPADPWRQANPNTSPPTADDGTSWLPRPILGDSDEGDDEPEPALLARSDGKRLLYAGKVNALIGESESGKTWVALYAIRQTLAEGGAVCMLDFEDTRRGVKARLRQLGAHDSEMAHFYYASPDEPLNPAGAAELTAFLDTRTPVLIVVDGVNAAMTLHGYDLQDNKDATTFNQQVVKPLARTGAAVVTIDHVTKAKDGRGNYAIGAQAKRADVDGCALIVEVISPFGRGMSGRLKLTVSKDRPGYVRGIAVGAKHAADVTIDSNTDGDVTMRVYPGEANDVVEARKLSSAMQAVSEALEQIGGGTNTPTNRDAVRALVGGNRDDVYGALDELLRLGHVTRDVPAGKGRAMGFRVARKYRSATAVEPATAFVPDRPEVVPDRPEDDG